MSGLINNVTIEENHEAVMATYDIPFKRPCFDGNELVYLAEANNKSKKRHKKKRCPIFTKSQTT